MKDCIGFPKALDDRVKLERIGMQTRFRKQCQRLSKTSEVVVWDDMLAARLFRMVVDQVKNKAGSMMWHAYGPPGMIAGLLCADSSQVKGRLRFLGSCHKFLPLAQGRMTATLRDMTTGQGLTSALMQWLLGAMAVTKFEDLPPAAEGMLGKMWGGSVLNSKSCEDVTKQVQGRAQRDSTNKLASTFEAWQAPTHHDIIGSYGRTKVKPVASVSPPSGSDWKQLAEALATNEPSQAGEEEPVPMREVMGGAQTWPTFSPASHQAIIADMVLLNYLCGSKDVEAAEEAWHASLVPEGTVVVKGAETFFVLCTYRRALLVWGLIPFGAGGLTFDLAGRPLDYLFVFDADSIKVQRFSVRSPLSQRISGANFGTAVGLQAIGEPTPLLDMLAASRVCPRPRCGNFRCPWASSPTAPRSGKATRTSPWPLTWRLTGGRMRMMMPL